MTMYIYCFFQAYLSVRKFSVEIEKKNEIKKSIRWIQKCVELPTTHKSASAGKTSYLSVTIKDFEMDR